MSPKPSMKFGSKNAIRDELTRNLIFVAFFACMGSFTFGYDNAWWGGVLGHPYFVEIFGTDTIKAGQTVRELTSTQISVGTAMGSACIGIGCMAAGYVADTIGRKRSFYVTAIGSGVGTVIEVTSGIGGGRFWQLVAGKLVICLAIGIASVSVPLYLAECAPGPIRGAMVNSYVWVQSIGGFVAYGVIYGILSKQSQIVWILPICLQMLAPFVTCVMAPRLPESPRWLVEKGRTDEARSALLFLRGGKEGYDVEADVRGLEESFRIAQTKRQLGWLECFKGRNLARTNVCVGVQSLQQGQGLAFIANYMVIFFIQLGIENPYMILLIIYGAIMIPFTATGFFTQDYFGRRTLLMTGGSVMGASMLALAGVVASTSDGTVTGAKANVCVFFIVLWLVAFTQSWTGIPWTVSAEVPADDLRDKTLALGAASGYWIGMVVSLVSPYLQQEPVNMGGKIGFIWGGVSAITLAWVFWFVPELKGRTLEQIDYMYDRGVPARKMSTYVMETLPEESEQVDPAYPVDDKMAEKGEFAHDDEFHARA
ncbi:hypothetical protein FFLO_04398 [Filobasidium floriforme]|uniref:Major facilitator superfamily (MFS) profile domain-containing protein n=1 Tax=Filobasidium floriforme TaxID=5210 RepID=A0A8K0JJI0_9TREE|nr:hypothetical protein FFLO_04398 [Filobasidium floriforme]